MKSHQQSKRNGQRGFGLVEVLIAVAVLSILALGLSTIISDMFKMQRKTNAVTAISQMRSLIIAAAQNGEAWARTADIAQNPDMTCMITGAPTPCTASVDGYDLNLYDPQGNAIFLARNAAFGFQTNGTTCLTYPSEICPFRWDLKWVPTCPGAAATCMTPTVMIVGTLQYTPGTEQLPGGFNPENYAISVLRGSEAIRNDPVVVVFQDNTANGETGTIPGTANPASSCKGIWVQRNLNRVLQDAGNNLINKAGAVPGALSTMNVVTLRPGTYTCRVQVPGFKNGGNRIRMVSVAGTAFADVFSGSTVAVLNGGSAVSNIDTTLVLSQQTTFRIEHTCTSNYTDAVPPGFGHGNPVPANDFTLGVPIASPDYSAVIYTSVSCSRTS